MKILMVCLGNICRSPLAEGILKSKLPDIFLVDSAGTISNHRGENPDHRSIKTAENHGIDISKQVSRQILKNDLEEYDYIFCMDKNNLKDVLALAKNEKQKAKVSLLVENKNVPDPYWDKLEDFEIVFQMIDEACEKIAKKLIKTQDASQLNLGE